MEAYYHNDPRIEKWVEQIIEKVFTACILTGVDSDAEYQRGCEIVAKITSLLQGFSTFPSEYLADGLKQILEQQLPESRVINNFPTFQDTMNKMLHEGMLKVIDAQNIRGVNILAAPSKENISENHIELFSELVQLKLNIETSVGDSSPTEAGYGGPLPLKEVGVLRLDKSKGNFEEELAREHGVELGMVEAEELLNQRNKTALSSINLTDIERDASERLEFTEELKPIPVLASINHKDVVVFIEQIESQVLSKPMSTITADSLDHIAIISRDELKADIESHTKSDTSNNTSSIVTSIQSKTNKLVQATQVPDNAERLNDILSYIFPNVTVNWNITLLSQKFLAQVEDILIYLYDPEHAFQTERFKKDGWKIMVCNEEDLGYPRRLGRKLKSIMRLGKRD